MLLVANRKEKSILVLAFLALGYGIAVTASGHAVWDDGIHEIFGMQARIVGILSIVFSAALFVTYFRRRGGS